MMLSTIATIVTLAISIGAIIVSITTQLNHVAHLKSDMERHGAEIKDIYIKIDGIHEACAETRADIKALKGVCDERHRT